MLIAFCAVWCKTQHEKPVDSGLNIPDSEEPHLSKAPYWGDEIKKMIEEADKTNDEFKKTILEMEPLEEEVLMLETMGIMGNAFISYADPIDQDKLMRIDDLINQRCEHANISHSQLRPHSNRNAPSTSAKGVALWRGTEPCRGHPAGSSSSTISQACLSWSPRCEAAFCCS